MEVLPQSLHCGGDTAFKHRDNLGGHFSNGARYQVLQQLFREVFQGAWGHSRFLAEGLTVTGLGSPERT
jgi:hypothetical protein